MSAGAGTGTSLRRLADETFDVLVVGGGATGAATARDAALRGLRVALVEAGDFASATSSASSKLIHGGVRYLQYGNLALVFEALRERRILLATAPHLCRPIEFVFPGYRGQWPGLRMLGAGIRLYDALALWRAPAASRPLSARGVHELVPWLRAAGLRGAQVYVDCQTDDARLVLENVLDAEAAGAVAVSHARVERLIRDRHGRTRAVDIVTADGGERLTARATVIVNATGPFSDAFDRGQRHLRPTLGVHVVVDAQRLPTGGRAVVINHPRDGRLMFALPAGPRTIVGTTDTDWRPEAVGNGQGGDAGDAGPGDRPPRPGDVVRAHAADVDYVLEAANFAFPPAALGHRDVLSTFAGLRPLVASAAVTPSATSREHEMRLDGDGVLSVVGGKLTTLRSMGQEAVDRALELLRDRGFEGAVRLCETATRCLPGGGRPDLGARELPPDVARHLGEAYGARAGEVVALADAEAGLGARVDPELPVLWAEAVHAVRHERAVEVEDVLARRTSVMRDARDHGLGAAPRVADILAREHAWSPARRERSLAAYRAAVDNSRRWRSEA